MKYTKILPAAAGLILASAAQLASATAIVLPGVPLPAGVPALPDLTVSGGGSLALPSLPLPLPIPLPIPSSGGSVAVSGGVGGPAYVVKPTTIDVEGADLPGLPPLPGL